MIVGTAGHVDHGKSTVVRLLTGSEPDRWAEEHRRGLTIGLGFAFVELAGDGSPGSRGSPDTSSSNGAPMGSTLLGVVDVPGHGRFLPTMLQGAHAVDVALLVVAAHEGWMPQTAEHVAVLDALGTPTGVVVITHVDRVTVARVGEVTEALRGHLAGTFLAAAIGDPARTVCIDGTTGAGLADLREALRLAVVEAAGEPRGPVRGGRGRPRLWVDRSFGVRGAGRVSTGTLTGGALTVGARTGVYQRGTIASTRGTRIVSLQVHDVAAREVGPGQRVGVRLGDKATTPQVGDALVVVGGPGSGTRELPGPQWKSGRHLHAGIRAFDPATPLRQRSGYDLVVGTGRWSVELRRSPRVTGPLRPGASGPAAVACAAGAGAVTDQDRRRNGPAEWDPVRLHAAREVGPVAPGDRFVLVDTGTSRAVGGGVVLAVDGSVIRRDERSLERRLAALLAHDADLLARALVAETGPVLRSADVLAEIGHVPDRFWEDPPSGLVFDREAVQRSVRVLARALEGHPEDHRVGPAGVVVDPDPLVRFAAGLLVANDRAVLRDGRLWRDREDHLTAASESVRALEQVAGAVLWRPGDLIDAVVASGLAPSTVSVGLRSGTLAEVGREDGSGTIDDARRGRARDEPRIVSVAALERFGQLVIQRLDGSPAGLGELRDLLGLSRNDTLRVLEHLDAQGVTCREGDERVLVEVPRR